MFKILKRKIVNIILSIVSIASFLKMLAIENLARTPKYINTDYHMNSLPYIYICLIGLILIVFINVLYIFKDIEKRPDKN